eukprot:588207-Amorphochlora_amoeboformis.AAC.1
MFGIEKDVCSISPSDMLRDDSADSGSFWASEGKLDSKENLAKPVSETKSFKVNNIENQAIQEPKAPQPQEIKAYPKPWQSMQTLPSLPSHGMSRLVPQMGNDVQGTSQSSYSFSQRPLIMAAQPTTIQLPQYQNTYPAPSMGLVNIQPQQWLTTPSQPLPRYEHPQAHYIQVGTHPIYAPVWRSEEGIIYPPGATIPSPSVSPGTMSSGAIPPGAIPPGAIPPGAIPPGAIPPGAIPPGATICHPAQPPNATGIHPSYRNVYTTTQFISPAMHRPPAPAGYPTVKPTNAMSFKSLNSKLPSSNQNQMYYSVSRVEDMAGRKRLQYQCNFCRKNFAARSNVVVHIRTHTGEKPFVCVSCRRGFAQKSNLKRHINLLHPKSKSS